jgi:hypothetical protein
MIDLFKTNLLLFGKISRESGIENKISRNKVIFEGFYQCFFRENFLFSLKMKISFQQLQRFFVKGKALICHILKKIVNLLQYVLVCSLNEKNYQIFYFHI